MNQLQAVRLQDALDLAAGVHRPGAGSVELDIGLPVFERLAGLADLFVGQRQIVVRVGVGGSELQGGLVSNNGFLHAAGLVEHVAEIEVSEGVARVGFNRLAVMLFREGEILAVVVERAQIDVRRRVRRLDSRAPDDTRQWRRAGCWDLLPARCRAQTMPQPRSRAGWARTSAPACWSGRSRARKNPSGTGRRSAPAALPWWRKATRCFAVDQAPASSSGFSTPEACLRMASSDWRITAGRTLIAHRSRTFLISRRSEKE